MINVGIELTPSIDNKTGIGNYSYYLAKHLLESYQRDLFKFKFIYNFIKDRDRRKYLLNTPANKNYIIRIPKRYYNNLYKFKIPINLFVGKLDILHITGLVNIHTLANVKKVVTIHDMAFKRLEYLYDKTFIKRMDKIFYYLINTSDLIFSSSYSTTQDLIELYDTPASKIRTIYFGVSGVFKRDISKTELMNFHNKKALPENYFLFVGTLEKRKNLMNILKAFSNFKKIDKNNYHLVVIGKGDNSRLYELCEEYNINKYVLFTGYIKEEDLPYYFRLSKFLVYCSYYEGFGIPILEAFESDVPVITTNNSSMKELTGAAGIYVNDPENIDEICSIITQSSNLSGKERLNLIEQGQERLKKFSWSNSINEIVKNYKKLSQY